jgi:hypothetical protein
MNDLNPLPPKHSGTAPFGRTAAVVVGLACLAALVALLRIDPWATGGSGLPKSFDYDLEAYQKTDPALIGYEQTGRIPLGLVEPRAVAVGPEDRVYVAGDRAIHVHAAGGARLRQINLDGEPRSLGVGSTEHKFPGRIYAGIGDHVEVFDREGKPVAAWASLGPKAVITSIAPGEQEVYVADAGGRIVLRYDLEGRVLGRIGAPDESRNIRGFFIPSPYFDVAVAPDGLIRVVNPAPHRIEAFTPDGSLEQSWGKSSLGIEGFCGCCNPANMAVMADGRIVTAEKGIPRVKVYAADGKFLSVVAGPELLAAQATSAEETRDAHKLKVIDVAADSRGRVLVLDPALRSVRIFEPKLKAEKKP